MTEIATLPLPPAVLARLRTAESLRAELAGVIAERDAIRAELDTAGWERDTAQTEAAYLRDDILGKWQEARGAVVDQRIGLLLTSGDEPPPPPEDGGADIALVSLSTGEIYVRPHGRAVSEWCRYGTGHSYTDFVTMAERGPWVTVDGWRFRDHVGVVEADRRYRDTVYAAGIGQAEWPTETAGWADAIKALTDRRNSIGGQPEPREWINAWQSLAGATRMAWQSAHRRAEYLTEVIQRTPHDPEWLHQGEGVRRCNVCLVVEAEHLPIPEVATP